MQYYEVIARNAINSEVECFERTATSVSARIQDGIRVSCKKYQNNVRFKLFLLYEEDHSYGRRAATSLHRT